MDIHRVRFIEYDPKPIHCLAFSDVGAVPKLALSRSDGGVEIWASNEGVRYYKEGFVPGRTDTSIEAMVWCNGRLFTAGLTGEH